jgi:hypothetical protein
MSRVKSQEELIERITELQEEIRRLTEEYLYYIVKKHGKKKKNKKSIAQLERENDTQCLALLKSGKRCTKKRLSPVPDNCDPELCKLHNNSKFDGKIKKIELEPLPECSEDDSFEDSDDGITKVKLTVDADSDAIDQEGNIWCMEKQQIIGKKDLKTKQKVYFKTL